jgi:hypothetical protein
MEATAALQLTPAIPSFDIFADRENRPNNSRLFYAWFGKVPNTKSISKVDTKRIIKWMAAEMAESIVNTNAYEHYCRPEKRMALSSIKYFLKNELLLEIESEAATIVYASGNEILAQALLDNFKRFTKREKLTSDINLIVSYYSSLSTIPVKIKKPILNLRTHYNDDLEPLHAHILKNINKKGTKGLYLFHGLPGTGKSTYIRFLIHKLKKKVIFLSPRQGTNLENPEFSEFLIKNENAILVIEDAEEMIVSRDGNHISGISTLLNLSDGLLAASLGIQIIATFNTNISNIDRALLRKGRLTALYEFKELSQSKSASLITSLGFVNSSTSKPMALADIYNMEETAFNIKPERRAIGFVR